MNNNFSNFSNASNSRLTIGNWTAPGTEGHGSSDDWDKMKIVLGVLGGGAVLGTLALGSFEAYKKWCGGRSGGPTFRASEDIEMPTHDTPRVRPRALVPENLPPDFEATTRF